MDKNLENMENYSEIRKSLELHKSISENKRPDDNMRYNVNRINTERYFDIHWSWGSKIVKYFQRLHEKGEEVVSIDICGCASAHNMGADKSYCFNLQTPKFREVIKHESDVFVEGDIFSSDDFSMFINRLKSDGSIPALVTFEPMVGLQEYDPSLNKGATSNYNEVTYKQLEKRLKEVIGILKPGGYVYLERPFQSIGLAEFLQNIPQDEWNLSLNIKSLAKKSKCKIEVHEEIGGPYFLIHKSIKNKKKFPIS